MYSIAHEDDADDIPTKVINDAPTLMRIRRAAQIAQARLELTPDLAAAADALRGIEVLASEALR